MCVYICNHENNVPSPLSLQWLCENSWTGLGHMIYGYTFLVPMNQGMLNKLGKEHNSNV